MKTGNAGFGVKRWILWLALLMWLLPSLGLAEVGSVTLQGLSFPADAQEIDLGDLKVTMKELTAFLDQFPRVRHVDMFGTKVNKEDIEALVKRYPDVTFGWTIHIFGKKGGHDVRTDQTAFSTLHGDCYSHSSEQLEVLKYCTELRALDLGHNRVKDLSFLQGLTKLRVLILACNEIKDLSPLAGMTEMEYLELFSNSISDLSPLLNMPYLMDLNLTYNKVSGIEALCRMPQLKRLWVGHCIKNLPGAKLQSLKDALPDTQIIAEGEPTQNGWRKHAPYDVLHEMFQQGEYIPFADSHEEAAQ
ncbi:MAG: leucine-rich repeat domain-containing protein [Clostridia bacterium]|nr:leucine-rich repeat domain-containing protein [Clostridia bacterium]